jgi:predicted site-specific integrase-resolvase
MYLSPQKAAQKYDIHPKTLSRLALAGIIEAIRMPNSKHRRYSAASIEKYLGRAKERVTKNAQVSL